MFDPNFVRHRTGRIVRLLMFAPFFIAIFLGVFGFAVRALWNWLMPLLFHLPAITFWQAWGLMLLSWILLGGFRGLGGHGRSGRRGRRGGWDRWRRWREMTPEQRAALREKLDHCWEQASPAESGAGRPRKVEASRRRRSQSHSMRGRCERARTPAATVFGRRYFAAAAFCCSAIQASICRSSTGSGTEPSAARRRGTRGRRSASPSAFSARRAQLLDLQLAELVGERLARPGDVAVDLGLDLVERQRGVRGHVVDRLLARPAHRRGCRCRRPGGRRATSRRSGGRSCCRGRCRSPPPGPATRSRGPSPRRRPRCRSSGGSSAGPPSSLRQRDLQVVPGHRLVQRQRLEVVERPALQRVGVDPVDARLRAAMRRADVAAARVLGRDVGRHRLDACRAGAAAS